MLDDREFRNLAQESISHIMDNACHADMMFPEETIRSAVHGLFAPGCIYKDSFLNHAELMTREILRKNLEADKDFMELWEYLRSDEIMTLAEYLEANGHTPDEFRNTNLGIYIKIFCCSHYRYCCSIPDWQTFMNEHIHADSLTMIFLGEVFAEEQHPEETAPPASIFRDDDIIDEIISIYAGSPLAKDCRTMSDASASLFHGRTGTPHLMAEEYGFEKDKLMLALIGAYGSCGEEQQEDARSIIGNWADGALTLECSYFLKHLRFSRMIIRSRGYDVTIPSYFRKRLIALVAGLRAGCWYRAEDLWQSYKAMNAGLVFADMDSPWHAATARARMVRDRYGECMLPQTPQDDCRALYPRTDELFRKPVFFGMLYTLALFGCLAISEDKPVDTLFTTQKKMIPYSALHCLSKISLTEYGRWVLGLRDEKPKTASAFSEPVADRDLLLITYKGRSAKVRSFLSEISSPVGETRFRVTLASFTAGCDTPESIDGHIKAFREIISSKPPENWERFFRTVMASSLFMDAEAPGTLLSVRNDAAFREMLERTDIRRMLTRTENGMFFLPDAMKDRFIAAVARYGYIRPIRSKAEKEKDEACLKQDPS